MTLIEAFDTLNKGEFVSKENWNGSFIWLKPKTNVKSEWCKDPVLKMIADGLGGEVQAVPVMCKYNAQERTVQTGWVPTSTESIQDDWVKVNVEFDGEGLVVRVPHKKTEKPKYIEGDLFDGADVIRKPKK